MADDDKKSTDTQDLSKKSDDDLEITNSSSDNSADYDAMLEDATDDKKSEPAEDKTIGDAIEESKVPEEETSDDEELYQQASEELAKSDPEPTENKPKKGKKKIILLLIVLLLASGGAAAWYFLKYKKQTASPSTESSATEEQAETLPAIGYDPVNVSYAYKEADNLPFTVFYRPAEGGERAQAIKLNRDENVTDYDVVGQSVAYATENRVYTSVDGGSTFTKVLDLQAGEQLTSLKISSSGAKLAMALLPEDRSNNTTKYIDIAGGETTDLFSNKSAGIFISGWNDSTQRMTFREGCYNCDGYSFNLNLINLKDKKVTKLATNIKGDAVDAFASFAVSADVTKAIFAEGNADGANEGLGPALKPPYKIKLLDIAKNEISDLATVGTAGEKNPNGTDKTYTIKVGFLAGTTTPYYTNEKQLIAIKDGSPSTVFESSNTIVHAPFVSEEVAIVGTGSTSDYTLANYNVASKKSTTIFQGDSNTIIFGITTQ